MSLNNDEFHGITIYELSYGGIWGNGYEDLNSQINQLIHKIPTSQIMLLLLTNMNWLMLIREIIATD